MSTRSTIGIIKTDGTRRRIYCHYDGYLEHNGRLLLEHYNSLERVEELLALGNLSSLGKLISPTTDYHSFDNREKDVCVAYHRDRGEPLEFDDNGFEEYNYTFIESVNDWLVSYDGKTEFLFEVV